MMMKRIVLMACLLGTAACTQVVTSTTSEIRPMRYALVEFTQQLAAHDSAVAYAKRALTAEKIAVQPGDVSGGVVVGGPLHFNAEGDHPVLDATITITAMTRGSETKYRIYAASVMPAGAIGGVDARLMSLVQRLSRHINSMVSP
jgi:hypothetical protein